MLRYLLLFTSFAAQAGETAPPVTAGSYIQAALALGLIVLILLGVAWLAKKVTGGKGFGQGGMKIVGGVALGPRERIVLVEIGEEWLVVGIVPGQIRTLHHLPKGMSTPADTSPAVTEKPFAQWLQIFTERHKHD